MKELINLRKTREKHFLNDDGTITAYVYNEDVHYLENGEYKEIDNTLIEEDEYITNKSNNFKIKLNRNKYLVNMDLDNKNYLNISLKDNNNVPAKILNNEVIYENILPNIDFHYLISGKSLKENIYLKNKTNTNIIFNIDTNLKLVLKDNKVLAMDNEEVIYAFNPLFMFDVEDNISNNCNYKLTELGEKYELELILDQEYLNTAVYPVVIDPTVTTDKNDNVQDITLSSSDPDRVLNNLKYLYVGCNDENTVMRSLLKFDLPKIATGNNIIRATAFIKSLNYMNENSKIIEVYEVTKKWDELSASWHTMSNQYNPKLETYIAPPQIVYDTAIFELDLTNLVKRWYVDKENNGIMLKCIDESYDDAQSSYCFYSKTYDAINGTAERPLLIIDYRLQNGLLDYMTYESASLSYGGAYINNCTGNLTNKISLSEILDSDCLFGLSLTYNTHDVIMNTDKKFGLGFNLSYNDYIEETINQFMTKEYKYTSGDGNSHYFYKGEDEEVFHDEDGLSLTLEITNEITKEYVITDKNGNKYIFTNGYLSKIEYVDETYVNITRDSENKITKIKDSKNNEVTISYNNNQVIFTSQNKTITINIQDNKLNNIVTKNGIISYEYNNKSLISKIIDMSGMSIVFEYYDIEPYRVKKITQYGLNNIEGTSKSYSYEFNSTTVTDNKNNKMRYTFNNIGNTISTVLIGSDDSLKNAYGFSNSYVNELSTPETNKPLASSLPIKYGENLIVNGDFETNDSNLFSHLRSNEDSYTGNYSAKINSHANGEVRNLFENQKTYTFSAYFKNSNPIYIEVYATRANGQDIIYEYEVMPNAEFTKYDFTFDINYTYACVGFTFDVNDNGIAYMDNVVINEGSTANSYNLIDNSDFKDGINGWNINGHIDGQDEFIANPYDLVTLPSNEKAVQLNSIVNGGVSMIKTLNISGKKGDTFNFSFWYKNEGVVDINTGEWGNTVSISFFDSNDEFCEGTHNALLNYHADNWQFYTETCIAENDYDSIDIIVRSMYEANHLLVTNFSLIKDLGSYFYEYDEAGNLISSINPDKSESKMSYDKNNQLIGMFDAKGNNFTYEYDNIKTNRVLKGISPTGISNEIKYDINGNPVRTIINNVNPKGSTIDGNYYIRSKGTDKYITPDLITGELSLKNDTCSHYSYSIENHTEIKTEVNEEDNTSTQIETKVYNLSSSILPNYKLAKSSNTVILNKYATSSNFEFIKKGNGSYNIKLYDEDLYLKVTEDGIYLTTLEEAPAFEFYFEDTDTNEFIETKAEYTEDGKYITKITDSLGNKTEYNINQQTGLIDSTINAKGIETTYTYDEKDRLKSVEVDNKNVEYSYDNNMIKSIETGNKKYDFEYDSFFKPTKVKMNNKTLVTNEYEENNGQLKNTTYGNEAKINYEYDNFNRLIKIKKNNKVYENYYNNLGLLSKITINNQVEERFYYDFAKRLSSYVYQDEYRFNYKYDKNSNVNHKEYILGNNNYKLDYEFNGDDSVVKVMFDGNSLNYDYDYLGRLRSKNINGQLPIEFTYKRNGEKTSLIVDTIKFNNDVYKYNYDNLYNIIEILKNNEVINEYTYDNRSQLLSDTNYALNRKYIYTYNSEGNILTKEEYNLETNTLINKDNFKYENTYWEDQLTKFNDEVITYDQIGNPLTIGNKELTWINGRQLSNYKDGTTEVKYEYNMNGIRTSKEFGNNKIKYYLEGTKIIFEKRNNDVIYYIYDDRSNALGFKYKGKTYYYQKNYQNDITGIYDNNYNLVVTYKYDAWGKVISILDNTIEKVGTINPFRYRSYYYDEETKLYYLNSRYYNPKWCRFINADGYVATGQGICDSNMYLYCSNSPVNKTDYNGRFWGEVCSFLSNVGQGVSNLFVDYMYVYAGCGGLAVSDGPLPIADVLAAVVIVSVTTVIIGCAIYAAATTDTKVYTTVKDTPAKKENTEGTKIYRYGGTNPGNLTPKEKDITSGLSFSTIPSLPSATTTIEELNATGLVYAIKDGEHHVSVYPIGGTVEDWYNAGPNSPWTQAVKSVVVKWDGVN